MKQLLHRLLTCIIALTSILWTVVGMHLRPGLQNQAVLERPSSFLDEQSLRLKAIYHHAPAPGYLRRREVSSSEILSEDLDGSLLSVKPMISSIYRPRNSEQLRALKETGRRMRWTTILSNGPAEMESVYGLVPDVKDRPTVLALAIMTNNAYTSIDERESEDWYDLGPPWTVNSSFGWDSDGIRGHVFANADDSLIVISIKGTSAGLFSGGPTGEKDKRNDNLLFSCCCARVSRVWRTVCDCFTGTDYQCEASCLEKNLLDSDLYYDHAMEIYKDVSDRYPDATVWLTGHSLGGALASLVGQTFGVPTVTFEIPGDRLASSRLHLPHPPGAAHMPIWHFGHTGDPIFVGVCTGPLSSCWYGGFAMETRCHTSKVCVWDTVNEHGWRVDIRSHRVQDVIEYILKQPETFPLPECVPEAADCDDCGLWQFIDRRDSLPTVNTLHTENKLHNTDKQCVNSY